MGHSSHANPKETELTYVRPGWPGMVKVHACPGVQWVGAIENVSPAAAEKFSLLPAKNSSGAWVKVVQRIPLRVLVDTTHADPPPLRAGMSVEADTGLRRGLPHFVTATSGHPGRGG